MSLFNSLKRSKHPSDLWVPLHASSDITPEDVFSDASSPLFEDGEQKLEVPVNPASTHLFFMGIFAILVFLAGYGVYLNVRYGNEYKALATLNAQRVHDMSAPRGEIMSSDGEVLAYSELGFNLMLDPSKLPEEETEDLSVSLAGYFDRFSSDYFYKIISSAQERNLGSLVIAKNLTESEVSRVRSLLMDYPQLSLEERPQRVYPHGSVYSHLIGYTASITSEEAEKLSGYSLSDNVGKKGVEFYYERFLRGTKGLFAKFVTARGDVVEEKVLQPVKEGSSIHLTLDNKLQTETYQILKDSLREYGITSVAAVVMNPSNGDILAMVSLPDFDPNHFVTGLTEGQAEAYFQDPTSPLINRVALGEYATGSVIKPLIAAAALEEGIISADKVLQTHGYISVPSVYDPSIVYRFNDNKNHGAVDMRGAIAVSSNVYFYTIGGGYESQKGLGIERMARWLKEFGWGTQLGINFGSESSGRVPDPEWKMEVKGERWQIGDTYNASIGQGDILATPLQVAAATSVFANGGTLFRPNIVSGIYSQDGVMQESAKNDIINENFLSQSSVNVVREGMRQAVQTGSSIYFRNLPVTSAGKTGTAQTARKNNAWFTGFAPYENPEVVVTVLLEEGEGSNNAVRVAYRILDSYFRISSPELYPEPVPVQVAPEAETVPEEDSENIN